MSLISASLRFLTNARALDVAVVDGAGDHVTGFDGSRPANATLTTVVASTTSQVLVAANAARRRLVVHNDGTGAIFVAFAATATTAAFTYEIGGNNTWDGPLNDYTGVVSIIRSGGTSNVRVTEVTT